MRCTDDEQFNIPICSSSTQFPVLSCLSSRCTKKFGKFHKTVSVSGYYCCPHEISCYRTTVQCGRLIRCSDKYGQCLVLIKSLYKNIALSILAHNPKNPVNLVESTNLMRFLSRSTVKVINISLKDPHLAIMLSAFSRLRALFIPYP